MKQRNPTIDYIKAIGVIGVMIMHLHPPIRYVAPIITNCYIPLFFICSGYTTSQDKTINLKRKCSSLMFPYIFYYLLFFSLFLFFLVLLSLRDMNLLAFYIQEVKLQELIFNR